MVTTNGRNVMINVGFSADYADGVLADMIPTARSPGSVDAPWDEKFADLHNCGPTGWPLEDFGLIVITHVKLVPETGEVGCVTVATTVPVQPKPSVI